jgi:hypothetical protein
MQLLFQNNVPLAANAVFTVGPMSCQADGLYVRVTSYSDQPGSLALYQTDTPTTGLFAANTIVDQITTSGGTLGKIEAVITAQFWQAIFTNGPTAQTVFQHYAWATPNLNLAVLAEWRRVNQQIMAMRGPYDSTLGEG